MVSSQEMNIAFVIGNGHSRSVFDLDNLIGKGETYGCNLLAHDHDLDNIIACDRAMLVNLASQGYGTRSRLWTRSRWKKLIADNSILALPDPVEQPKHRFDRELNWNSGVHAINLAASRDADVVVMIGFDIWPRADGRNNIYQDRDGYKSDAIDPSHWIYQIRLLLDKYPTVSFVQIQPESWNDPTEWIGVDNYSRDSYSGLREWLGTL